MRGEGWHRAKGGRGGGGVEFETKSRAEEVKERNNVEGSSHTNTLHTHTAEVFINISVNGRAARVTMQDTLMRDEESEF